MGRLGHGIARGRLGVDNHLGLNSDVTIHFKKTGADIKAAIETKLKTLRENCTEDEKEITIVCERRGIKAEEVIDAANDEGATQLYESKAYSNAPAKHNKILEEMQSDMSLLRQLSASIAFTKEGIGALMTVQENIEVKREFDLTFSELKFFGF